MKRLLILCAAAVLSLTSCNFLEAMRQTSPHRSDKPVLFSDAWREQRREAKAERKRAEQQNADAALAFKILTTPAKD